jgi:hypothetical protein
MTFYAPKTFIKCQIYHLLGNYYSLGQVGPDCTSLRLYMGRTEPGLHNRIVPSSCAQVEYTQQHSDCIQVGHDQDPQHLLGFSVLVNLAKSSQKSYQVSVQSAEPNICTPYRASEHHD